jgi:hypothetical protein
MDRNDSDARPFDPRLALRGFLILDAVTRLVIWCVAVAGTSAIFTALHAWPLQPIIGADFSHACQWASRMALWIALFNILYVLVLVLMRVTTPTPKEGRYSIAPGSRIDRQLIYSCMVAILTKARYEAPFPGFLVFHAANLPPMVWLMGPVFGPRSKSCYVTEPLFIDPSLIEVGRNVVFGFGSVISAHTQTHDEIIIKKTRIEDDVLIGGNVIIYGGCVICRGAVVLGGAIVKPETIIGPYEIWGGVPAKKIKDATHHRAPHHDSEPQPV